MGSKDRSGRGGRGWCLGALTLILAAGCASPSLLAPRSAITIESADIIEVTDTTLALRMGVLASQSSIWRAGLDTIRANGFRVLVATPEQVPGLVAGMETYRARHFGEVIPIRDRWGAIIGAVVTVDVPRLERLYRLTGLPDEMLDLDIDRILIHEIYGHVVPLSQTRTIPGGCPDPKPGAPAETSCAIRRENRIREELGLEPRVTYDLRGLSIGRFLYSARGPVAAGRE